MLKLSIIYNHSNLRFLTFLAAAITSTNILCFHKDIFNPIVIYTNEDI